MIAGIVLAAGESRRMGQLKPLLKIGEKTFLQHITGQLKTAGVHPVIVVLGYLPEVILENSGINCDHAINVHYRLGQFSSLQTGIHALPSECRGVVVCLGDQPQLRHEWVRKLIQAFDQHDPDMVIPQFNGRSGHPVIYSSRLFDEIKSMSPSSTARELRERHTPSILRIDIDTDAILYDADTPQDLENIRTRFMPD